MLDLSYAQMIQAAPLLHLHTVFAAHLQAYCSSRTMGNCWTQQLCCYCSASPAHTHLPHACSSKWVWKMCCACCDPPNPWTHNKSWTTPFHTSCQPPFLNQQHATLSKHHTTSAQLCTLTYLRIAGRHPLPQLPLPQTLRQEGMHRLHWHVHWKRSSRGLQLQRRHVSA